MLSVSLVLAALPLAAQVVGGTISGIVTDPAGAPVSGASVLLHNLETGNERHLKTDATGSYAAPSVPVGRYSVTVTSDGFAPQSRRGVALSIGQAVRVNLALTLGAVSETLTVEATPAAVNPSTQETAGLVNERQVKGLPLNGRSYDQLLTLNPATVNYTAQRSGSVGTSNSSVGSMFVIAGRRPQDNLFLLNGVEYTGASLINVTPGGTSGQLLGVEAVREFNVMPETYGAAYGKRQGAQISIVTASGTNTFHGAAYEFLRNSAFDARNYFDRKLPEFQRNNFGASLGGPLRRNKAFVFANYEGYRQNLGLSNVTLVPDDRVRQGYLPDGKGGESAVILGAGVAPLLELWPRQNGPELHDPRTGYNTGIAQAFSSPAQHIREDFGTARFDANLAANDLLFAVYTADDSSAHTPTQNPFSLIDERLREQVASVQEQHVFSPQLLNTARLGFSRASFYFEGSTTGGSIPGFVAGRPVGAIVIAGSTASNGSSQITGAGGNVGSNNATSRDLYTADDHIYLGRGRQQLEVGGWVQWLQSNDNLAQNQDGQASFATLGSFLAGTVKTFTVVPNPTPLNWRSWMGAGYVEDTIKLTPDLELRAGVRVESTSGWNEAHGRAGNYRFTGDVIDSAPHVGGSALSENRARFLPEPRVGLAWNVGGRGVTAVRASFGMHHSLLDNLDYRLDQAAPFNTTYSYSNVPVTAPTAAKAGLISPSSVQADIATPTVLAWTLRIEQQLSSSTSLTVGYSGSHGYHQILSGDLNEPAFVVCGSGGSCPEGAGAGTIFYPSTVKANPAVSNTTSWFSSGSSAYHGLELDLRRSFAQGLQVRANYTFARNLDDGSAWNTSVSANTPAYVSVPRLARLDWGLAATDIRHLGAINGSYDLPFGTGRRYGGGAGAGVERLISGYTLASIVSVQSGFPFSPQLGYNPTGSGDTRNPVRPDVQPGFHGRRYAGGSTASRSAQFFNPAAFEAPAYGTVGNLGRDTLTGPGYTDWDLSLAKSTQVSEAVRAELRGEFFNVLNHTNLGTPNEVVYSAGPTQGSAASQSAVAAASPTAGVITSAATSRQIQISLKLLF